MADHIIGLWFRMKYRFTFLEHGSYYEAARNLRKQGVPLAIARLILFGRT